MSKTKTNGTAGAAPGTPSTPGQGGAATARPRRKPAPKPATEWAPKQTAYMLRTVTQDGESYGGYRWDTNIGAINRAPDWNPEPECGCGLHGLLWGEGSSLLLGGVDDLWLVCEIDAAEAVDLSGKVKVPAARVVFAGERDAAVLHLDSLGATQRAVVFARRTGGDYSTLAGGDGSILTGGDRSILTGGDRSTLTGGNGSILTGGDYSTLAGGDGSILTGGDGSTLTGGNGSILTGGDGSILVLRWWDGRRYRLCVGYVGEDEIEAGKPYRCEGGKLVPAEGGAQ